MFGGDLLSAAGCLFGLAGVVLAVYFYLKSRRIKRLVFDTRTFGFLSDATTSLPGFRASFRNHELKTLTAARILLWNSGTEIAQGSDVADADPISFRLPEDCEILSATITNSSDSTNEVRLRSPDDQRNALQITFDYLAPR